jgi:hypothetical protein
MSTLDRLLKIDIEGYLFNDLAEMQRDDVRVAFPLLMASCAGIELLGRLVAPGTAKDPGAERCFLCYWNEYLYPDDPEKSELGRTIYTLVRNGLGHTFLLKGPIAVAKHEIRDQHLKWVADPRTGHLLHIDASQLADDLKASYNARFLPLATTTEGEAPNRHTMQLRLDWLIQRYLKEAARYRPKADSLSRVAERSVASSTTASTTSSTGVFIFPAITDRRDA